MDPKTFTRLESADDSHAWEYPADFDWQIAIERVRFIRPILEAIAGRPLCLDDRVQDATFFAELQIVETKEVDGLRDTRVTFSVAYSNFGSLVTIFNNEVFSEEKIEQMRAVLEGGGFIFIEWALLSEPYDGPHAGFHGKTWLDRFFNYT